MLYHRYYKNSHQDGWEIIAAPGTLAISSLEMKWRKILQTSSGTPRMPNLIKMQVCTLIAWIIRKCLWESQVNNECCRRHRGWDFYFTGKEINCLRG